MVVSLVAATSVAGSVPSRLKWLPFIPALTNVIAVRIRFVFRRSQHNDWCFLHWVRRKNGEAGDFRDIQVGNDNVRLGVRFTEYFQRLFAIASDVEMDGYLAFSQRLHNKKRISGVVYIQADF